MTTTATPARSRDTVYRIVAVAVLVVAGIVVTLLYRSSAGDSSTAPQDRSISVTITGGRAEPPVGRVEVGKGSTIRLTVTSDAPDELHVHGYDRRAVLEPGRPATLEFRADTTGMFEIETHGGHLLLVQLVVR
ncbi:cupredoxin domain-containing protein [Dactylosporangium sp. NPDC005555]|uniref:cupredoxin domain-containing protein n=1 Tax=Dactylosporangium sp. NPDC005555 TaxID=3154889 RepID=UPI0033BDD791